MKSKITLKQIAKEFDVSISTVSKALNDSHEISLEVKEKIKAFADYYHYKPNSLALNLRNQKTKTIGVIIPEIVHHFFSKVISGIEKKANENGYNVMICLSNESYEKEVLQMEMLSKGVVDGILISVANETESIKEHKHFHELVRDGLPMVLFDRVIDEINCHKVVADDVGGGQLATEHLIDVGCKRIAILTTPNHVSVGRKRLEGYKQALKKNNIELKEEYIVTIDEYKNVAPQIEKLLNLKDRPDGIFAVNEIYAATAMQIAHKKRIDIPNELAIMGFTDGVISSFTYPALSTVAQHGYQLGYESMSLLLEEIQNQDTDYQYKTVTIETDIKARESTHKLKTTSFK